MFLQKEIASNQRAIFFCMDVVCKYMPYLHKIGKACPEYRHLLEMKPFLSVLHAKAHGLKCEVSYQFHLHTMSLNLRLCLIIN